MACGEASLTCFKHHAVSELGPGVFLFCFSYNVIQANHILAMWAPGRRACPPVCQAQAFSLRPVPWAQTVQQNPRYQRCFQKQQGFLTDQLLVMVPAVGHKGSLGWPGMVI